MDSQKDATENLGSSRCCPSCGQPIPVKDNWNGWIAVLFEHDADDCNWCIAPKEFWDEHHHMPDHCLDHVPTGFFESQEHTLDSSLSLPEQERLLREYGFEIVEWPD